MRDNSIVKVVFGLSLGESGRQDVWSDHRFKPEAHFIFMFHSNAPYNVSVIDAFHQNQVFYPSDSWIQIFKLLYTVYCNSRLFFLSSSVLFLSGCTLLCTCALRCVNSKRILVCLVLSVLPGYCKQWGLIKFSASFWRGSKFRLSSQGVSHLRYETKWNLWSIRVIIYEPCLFLSWFCTLYMTHECNCKKMQIWCEKRGEKTKRGWAVH